jgi:hypothetical protein
MIDILRGFEMVLSPQTLSTRIMFYKQRLQATIFEILSNTKKTTRAGLL